MSKRKTQPQGATMQTPPVDEQKKDVIDETAGAEQLGAENQPPVEGDQEGTGTENGAANEGAGDESDTPAGAGTDTEQQPPVTEVVEPQSEQPPVTDPDPAPKPLLDMSAPPKVAEESNLLKVFRAGLANYIEAMGPSRPQTADSVVQHQRRLYDLYRLQYRLSPMDWRVAMDLFMEAFREHKDGVFGPRLRNRGMESVNLSKDEAMFLQQYSDMLYRAANADSIEILTRLVDIPAIANRVGGEQGARLLMAYFKL